MEVSEGAVAHGTASHPNWESQQRFPAGVTPQGVLKGPWQRPCWRPGAAKWVREEGEGKDQAEGPRPERETYSRNPE